MSLIWWLSLGEWRGGPEVGGPWYAFQYSPKLMMMMMGKEHDKVSTGCYLLALFPWLKLQLIRRTASMLYVCPVRKHRHTCSPMHTTWRTLLPQAKSIKDSSSFGGIQSKRLASSAQHTSFAFSPGPSFKRYSIGLSTSPSARVFS